MYGPVVELKAARQMFKQREGPLSFRRYRRHKYRDSIEKTERNPRRALAPRRSSARIRRAVSKNLSLSLSREREREGESRLLKSTQVLLRALSARLHDPAIARWPAHTNIQ